MHLVRNGIAAKLSGLVAKVTLRCGHIKDNNYDMNYQST